MRDTELLDALLAMVADAADPEVRETAIRVLEHRTGCNIVRLLADWERRRQRTLIQIFSGDNRPSTGWLETLLAD